MGTMGGGRAGRAMGRQAVVALSVVGLVAVVIVALLAARAAAGAVLGSAAEGPGAGGNGAPCAVNTPHATVAHGDGIVAVIYLWTMRGTPGPTATPYDPAATPIETGTRETVCILRASDGALLTHYDIGATGLEVVLEPETLVALAPDGSELYLSSYTPETHSARLCALAALTGAILWCQQLTGFVEQAAVDDTALYVLVNGTLEALDPATGRPRWQQNGFYYDELRPFVLDGDRILERFSDGVADYDELCAWRTSDGSVAWCQRTAFDRPVFLFSAGGGYATAVARLTDSLLVQEWRASDGSPVWQQRLTGLGDPQQMLNAGGGVYLSIQNASSSLDYLLIALDAATGAREWTRDTHTIPVSFVGGGSGFVATQSGTLLGYLPPSPASSKPVWQRTVTQGGGGADFISTSTVFYTVGGSTVGAVRVSDGKPLWEATNCRDGSESAPARDGDGATRWCHWPDADSGFEAAVVAGSAFM